MTLNLEERSRTLCSSSFRSTFSASGLQPITRAPAHSDDVSSKFVTFDSNSRSEKLRCAKKLVCIFKYNMCPKNYHLSGLHYGS